MIRDRIVFGIDDDDLREKFIEDGGNPSLDEVIQACIVFGLRTEQFERLHDTSVGLLIVGTYLDGGVQINCVRNSQR